MVLPKCREWWWLLQPTRGFGMQYWPIKRYKSFVRVSMDSKVRVFSQVSIGSFCRKELVLVILCKCFIFWLCRILNFVTEDLRADFQSQGQDFSPYAGCDWREVNVVVQSYKLCNFVLCRFSSGWVETKEEALWEEFQHFLTSFLEHKEGIFKLPTKLPGFYDIAVRGSWQERAWQWENQPFRALGEGLHDAGNGGLVYSGLQEISCCETRLTLSFQQQRIGIICDICRYVPHDHVRMNNRSSFTLISYMVCMKRLCCFEFLMICCLLALHL